MLLTCRENPTYLSDMTDLDRFKTKVKDFLDRTGVSRRNFGKYACNDGSFVWDLLAGREPRFSTIRKVEQWMELYDTDPDKAMGRPGGRPMVKMRAA